MSTNLSIDAGLKTIHQAIEVLESKDELIQQSNETNKMLVSKLLEAKKENSSLSETLKARDLEIKELLQGKIPTRILNEYIEEHGREMQRKLDRANEELENLKLLVQEKFK